MSQDTLYRECPLCAQAPVTQHDDVYRCENCGLTVKEKAVLGLFNKGKYGVVSLGEGDFGLASASVRDVVLPPDPLKIVIGNIYTDSQLAEIAGGDVQAIRPVRTVLAQIILEQLREECFVNVTGLRRAFGPPLPESSHYQPQEKVPLHGLQWLDEGNLFCTTQRLVLPSNQFTFIRLGRKISAVQAFTNGVAIQQKNEEQATYFVGCYPHEAALVAAYVMAKVPLLRPAAPAQNSP
ncbi:MAG: hypothetical protein Kow0031_34950 [Anaerolineae bacterium]